MAMSSTALSLADHLPALQVLVPFCGSIACALIRQRHVSAAITIACSLSMPVIAFLLLVEVRETGVISYAMGGWEPPLGIEYRVDIANAFLLILVSLMGAVVALFAPRSIAVEIVPEKAGWYYSMYLMCLSGLLGMAITGDAFNIFVFMEISSLAMYAMIALGSERRAIVAAYQYLIIGTIGASFYVIGAGLIFSMTGSLNLYDLSIRMQEIETTRPLVAGLAFIVVGIGLKLAMFPLHLWLPNAYAYAPTVATAFIASTATKVAVYLLLRFLFSIFGVEFSFGLTPAAEIMTILAVLGMIVASTTAIFQVNAKRMLAYSSVAQVGYMLMGIALVSEAGLAGSISHLFNHAVIKAALFLALGVVFFSTGVTRIENMAGLGRIMPLTMGAFVITGLGLIGVPGTAGFVSKWLLIEGAADVGDWWLIVAIVISSVLAVVYVGRVIEVAYFREPKVSVVRKPGWEMIAILWLLVGATIWFGVDTELNEEIAREAARALLAGYGEGR